MVRGFEKDSTEAGREAGGEGVDHLLGDAGAGGDEALDDGVVVGPRGERPAGAVAGELASVQGPSEWGRAVLGFDEFEWGTGEEEEFGDGSVSHPAGVVEGGFPAVAEGCRGEAEGEEGTDSFESAAPGEGGEQGPIAGGEPVTEVGMPFEFGACGGFVSAGAGSEEAVGGGEFLVDVVGEEDGGEVGAAEQGGFAEGGEAEVVGGAEVGAPLGEPLEEGGVSIVVDHGMDEGVAQVIGEVGGCTMVEEELEAGEVVVVEFSMDGVGSGDGGTVFEQETGAGGVVEFGGVVERFAVVGVGPGFEQDTGEFGVVGATGSGVEGAEFPAVRGCAAGPGGVGIGAGLEEFPGHGHDAGREVGMGTEEGGEDGVEQRG